MGKAMNAAGEIVEFNDPTPEQRAVAKARAEAHRAAKQAKKQESTTSPSD